MRKIFGQFTFAAVIALAAVNSYGDTLSYNFDPEPFGVDIAGPKSQRPGATVADEVTSVARKLSEIKGRHGKTIFPAGTQIDRSEVKDGLLTVWVTFPPNIKEHTLNRGLTYQGAEILSHFFSESQNLHGTQILARAQGQTEYKKLDSFVLDEDTLISKPQTSQDWYEPNGPGPQSDKVEQLGTRNVTGQGQASSSGAPSGALSGRIIFTYGGHGRTWDGTLTTPAWRWQRGFVNNMMEDFGNVDGCDAFAMYCFNAGATVVPFRPIGYQNNEVIVDNPSATLAGTWSNSSSTRYYGSGTPYYFASASASETATATYTPNIPAAGYYPVYTWANYGSDRVPGGQLYKIKTTGGESQVRVDHRRVGCGWVYLGTYYFYAGSNAATGSVVISNQSASSGVVIADAIRFGNGMGDANNGGGISGYSRREESTVYWIQNGWGQGDTSGASLIWNNANTADDENQSWQAPPRMAAQMYRVHADTTVTDMRYALYLGWHSNAGSGTARGSEGLITGTSTPNQAWWAAKVSDEVDASGVEEDANWEYTWNDRVSSTYTGAYGEITADYFDYPLGDNVPKMDATIIEVAYHDNVSDAALLRDPKVRNVNGRGAYHAAVQYFNNFKAGTLAYLPEPPTRFRVTNNGSGAVTLNWQPGPTGGTKGQAATSYRVYQSPDGLGWGGGTASATNSLTVNGLTAGQTYFFRVAGVNAGGESFPSDTLAVRVKASGTPKVLIVQGYDRLDRYNNVNRGLSSVVEQLILERNNSYNYVRQHAAAIAAYGLTFDSADNESVINSDINLNSYDAVVWIAGEESSADKTFSATERTKVTSFLNAGNKNLFVSGAEIGYELDFQAVDASFYNNYLAADYAADDGGSYQATGAAGTIFAGIVMNFPASSTVYDADYPDRLNTFGGSVIAANYTNGGSGGAAVQFSGGSPARKVVNMGFPFECISSTSVQNQVMAAAMGFFGVTDTVAAVPDWQMY